MNLRNTVEGQMASSLCLFRNPLPLIAVLVPLLIFYGFWGFGFLSILLTSSVLILSTVYFTFSKQKPLLVEKSEEEISLRSDQDSLPHMEEVVSKLQPEIQTITRKKEAREDGMSQIHDYPVKSPDSLSESSTHMEEVVSKLQPESKTITQKKGAQEGGIGQIHDYLVRSPDSLSESESIDQSSTSEDSEVDWPFQDNLGRSSVCSDGSISDEESLIEITLPSGHYVGSKDEEEPKSNLNLQQKLPDFSTESMFRQHSLMELLADINDMNEEENLIEIDISMGSIKCSRFEIEA
ncbi:hypothetical protein L1049_024826 [Liquidambar formosana]|uniref:Uncharacterized protein n=1 Tax=Liquidambar formosana TaxID=63359 RepID=A0AAP0RWQ0_LIQFO